MKVTLVCILPHILSPFVVTAITVQVPDRYLFYHFHQLLVHNLSGFAPPPLYRAQGFLIYANIGNFSVEICVEQKQKACILHQQERKVLHDLFGTVLMNTLNLFQAATVGDIPHFGKTWKWLRNNIRYWSSRDT